MSPLYWVGLALVAAGMVARLPLVMWMGCGLCIGTLVGMWVLQ